MKRRRCIFPIDLTAPGAVEVSTSRPTSPEVARRHAEGLARIRLRALKRGAA